MSEPLTTAGRSDHGAPDPLPDCVTYALRGCQYPGCGKETRAYVEVNGLSYCEEHAQLVEAERRVHEVFTGAER